MRSCWKRANECWLGEYFEAQLDLDDSWTDLSQEALNSDPVVMDVSLEEASKSATPSHGSVQSESATPSHGPVQSGSDSTDSSLLIRTGGTRIVVFEDEDDNNETEFNVLGSLLLQSQDTMVL